MANDVDIANIALAHVGGNRISSLTENSREGRTVATFYESTRDAILRTVRWRFARKQVVLTELSETRSGYTYVYAYPSDCIEAIEIYNSAKANDEDLIDFDQGVSSDGSKRVILTEQFQAELIYTSRVTNATLFDPIFADAFAWALAGKLAVPFKASEESQQAALQAYERAIGVGKAADQNEHSHAPQETSSFHKARD